MAGENDHNPYFLRDKLKWQQRNFDRALAQIHSVTEDMTRDIHYATEEREITYSPDIRRDYTHADAAAAIVSLVPQAVSNFDLRGLVQTAADLAITHSLLHALEPLAEADPKLKERWRVEYVRWLDAKTGDEAARQKKINEQCECHVAEGGRGVGFRQCTKKSVETIDLGEYGTLRRCGTHRKLNERRAFRSSGPLNTAVRPS